MDPHQESVLRAGAQALQVALDDGAIDRLLRYADLLIKWNQTYNLTAIRSPDDIITHHVLDSLAVAAPLRKLTSAIHNPRLLDVGSGAGLPGVMLAIACPKFRVTCIDAVQKKTNFLQHVIGALALANLSARHERIEEVTDPFDVIAARAFASLAQFTAQSRGALAANGIWCAMKGKYPNDEIAALGTSVQVFHVEQLNVPGLNAERCLICMRPAGTLATFPASH
ncbi:MAG: 16S rRNA (guanine(527)-N(7))-methyltransferase RsmG [Rhodanobacteraceae bacterium]|nr:MAG: 16S rRNA (guanine(527)-N(7))-methyltransferase RsmG [Rhodanobacteraceae bacterium]